MTRPQAVERKSTKLHFEAREEKLRAVSCAGCRAEAFNPQAPDRHFAGFRLHSHRRPNRSSQDPHSGRELPRPEFVFRAEASSYWEAVPAEAARRTAPGLDTNPAEP